MAKLLDTQTYDLSTRMLRSSRDPKDPYGEVVTPIYQTTAFAFESCNHAAELFSLTRSGHMYGSTSNPTNETLERRLCELEGGNDAVSTARGKAALMLAILSLVSAGDNIVSSRNLYGGTFAVFVATLPQMGIEVRFVEDDTPDAFLASADKQTRMFYGESLSNPMLQPFPIADVARAGATVGIPLVTDNTLTA